MMKEKKVSPNADADRFKKAAMALQDAQDFLNAYKILQAHNRACLTTKQQPVFTPDIVNLAFAIEIFLKALLYCSGKKVHGHKFDKLFECLPEQTQAEIKQGYTEHLVKTTGLDHDIFGLSFEAKLKQYADTFQYWRYFHEKGRGTFNSQFCENLGCVLNDIVETKLNEFRDAYLKTQSIK